ncbi:hypothetical protein [Marinomonas mediterranea]|uniref:hypothetical protein n=1 Tax=Marinomonas mediterranea TaxID=119864 RepID=UPI002349BEBC|nr:hypothetical protein [Marinomonas mediterranea]WCN09986.1 hypothetical protein GV055_14180 [Marinomonas mediterranea]
MTSLARNYSFQIIFTSCLLIISAGTTAMSYYGYQSLWPDLEGKIMASVMAVSTFASVYLYHSTVMKALVEHVELRKRLGVLALAAVFFVFIIGLSSAINVAALSGRAAQISYLSDLEKQASVSARDIFQQANGLRRFLPLFEQQAASWQQAAHDERTLGTFSRTVGGGGVSSILDQYSTQFQTLHSQTASFLFQVETLNGQANERLALIRQVIEDQKLSSPERMKKVAEHLDVLNGLLIKMQTKDFIEGMRIIVLNMPNALKAITLSSNPKVAEGQQAAIAKIKDRLSSGISLMDNAFSEYLAQSALELPELRPISTLNAVMVYWYLYPQSWVAGLALDLLPLFIGLVLMIVAPPFAPSERHWNVSVRDLLLAKKALQQLGHDPLTKEQNDD